MRAETLLYCSLAMAITSILLAAACAIACSRLASRCTRALKRRPPSDATLVRLATDQAALSSSLESLAATVKRISSRHGMRELRSSRAASEAPPPGAPKAEVLAFYGLRGKSGPAFAQAQLSLSKPGDTDG